MIEQSSGALPRFLGVVGLCCAQILLLVYLGFTGDDLGLVFGSNVFFLFSSLALTVMIDSSLLIFGWRGSFLLFLGVLGWFSLYVFYRHSRQDLRDFVLLILVFSPTWILRFSSLLTLVKEEELGNGRAAEH